MMELAKDVSLERYEWMSSLFVHLQQQQALLDPRYPRYWSCSSTAASEEQNGRRPNSQLQQTTEQLSSFMGQAMFAANQAVTNIVAVQARNGAEVGQIGMLQDAMARGMFQG